MRPHQLFQLADVLREHRERFEEVITELAERGEPISDLEARLIIDAGRARLSDVENALRSDALYGGNIFVRLTNLRPLVIRLRSLRIPRIGMLRQYPPKPLRVPTKYWRTPMPDPPPRISIVTPSYQQGRFLERTLYSVVSQGYPALEYVVQDGGSSDETLAVLRRFEPKLSRWKSEPDKGQGEAINRGFHQTTGEIMAWLNSDDLLLPGALAYVGRYFAEHPEVDVVYGHRIMIDENDGQIGAWVLPPHDDLAVTLSDFVPQETLFWRRRIWEAAGAFVDDSFRYAIDWDMLLRFRAAGATIVRLPRFLGAFRVHPEQKTTLDETVGLAECEQLRERLHGRPMSIEEVVAALKPYYEQHTRAHMRQRIVDRLPLPRRVLTTRPAEPWLRTAIPEPPSAKVPRADDAAIVSPLVPRPESAPGVEASLPPAERGSPEPSALESGRRT